jgi:hypothetical protein
MKRAPFGFRALQDQIDPHPSFRSVLELGHYLGDSEGSEADDEQGRLAIVNDPTDYCTGEPDRR